MLLPDPKIITFRQAAYTPALALVGKYLSCFATKPFEHQLVGIAYLLANPTFALFDEMGVAKSKQAIDAAGIMFAEDLIDRVVLVAPAKVCSRVWSDPEDGQLATHGWGIPGHPLHYNASYRRLLSGEGGLHGHLITWMTVSYELLRDEKHLQAITAWLNRVKGRTWLVLDECHALKNRTAQQTKAVAKLRELCERCTLMTGSPVANNPLDLWSPLRIMDRQVLPFKNFYQFRARYAVMGGYMHKQPVQWVNQDELQGLITPYVLRREKKDVLSYLPPKLFEQVEVPLSVESWKVYRELKQEAMAALGEGESVLTANAGVKLMRLSQVCQGFIGGVDNVDHPEAKVKELGQEKLQEIKELLDQWSDRRVVVWCRFRLQLQQVHLLLYRMERQAFKIWGGLTTKQQDVEIHGFKTYENAVMVAQQQAGGQGLNDLVLSSSVIYASNDFNLLSREQSEDRSHRPGQHNPVTYVDLLATGPNGQKTIDHVVLKALRQKRNLATETTAYWRRELADVKN